MIDNKIRTDPMLLAKVRAAAVAQARMEHELYRSRLEVMASCPAPQAITWVPTPDPLTSFTDADLIFEMIGRGYAVAKMSVEQLAEVA